MNTYLLKEAAKLALLSTSIDDHKFENTDALTELITSFYEDIEAFAQMLQFSKDEIENMDKTTAEKILILYNRDICKCRYCGEPVHTYKVSGRYMLC